MGFSDRVLSFDTDAARHHAVLTVAASRGFIVASRDTSHYEAGGLPVIDPWHS